MSKRKEFKTYYENGDNIGGSYLIMNFYKLVIFSICLLFLFTWSVFAETTDRDLGELSRISKLNSEQYCIERDLFLQSRTKPVDIDKAVQKGWQEGLLALILNARIAEPDYFKGSDKPNISVDIVGRLHMRGSGSLHYKAPEYGSPGWESYRLASVVSAIEKVWKYAGVDISRFRSDKELLQSKGIWANQALDKIADSFMRGSRFVPNPSLLWRKVAHGTSNQRLLLIACYYLAGDSGVASRNLISAKLKSNADIKIKAVIMNGLEDHQPDYTEQLLTETFQYWKKLNTKERNVAHMGFRAISKLPSNSKARRFQRELILDDNESEQLRSDAISGMFILRREYDPNDISCLEKVFKSTAPVSVRRRAASGLGVGPAGIAMQIFNKVAETENDPVILQECARQIERLKKYVKSPNRWQQLIQDKKTEEGKKSLSFD